MAPPALPRSDARPHWSPLPPWQRWQRGAGALLMAGAMAVTPWWVGQVRGGVCGFLRLTGLPCPLCGGTRVCAALVQGDWSSAWALNPGALAVVLWLALIGLQITAEALAGRCRSQPWPWLSRQGLWGLGGAVLLSWGYRLTAAS